MSKTKEEFLAQMHEKVFKAWWKENEILFPRVHTSDAKRIFIAAREEFEKQFLKQKKDNAKTERARRELQSKLDKQNKTTETNETT